jgi:hypothetical protein
MPTTKNIIKNWRKESERAVNKSREKLFISNSLSKIEYCIKNSTSTLIPMYFYSPTQSKKTFNKIELAAQALEHGYIDLVIVCTTNLNTAKQQLLDRFISAEENGYDYDTVDASTQKKPFYKKGNVIIVGNNVVRFKHLKENIINSCRIHSEHKNCPMNILWIQDEGEEVDMATGQDDSSAGREEVMYQMFNELLSSFPGMRIGYAKVSATPLSDMMMSHYWTGSDYEALSKEQIFEITLPHDYIGIQTNTISWDTNLQIEPIHVFNSNRIDCDLSTFMNNSVNLNTIVSKLKSKIDNDIVEVVSCVYGVSKESHDIMAAALEINLSNYGYKVANIDLRVNGITTYDIDSDIILLRHNGENGGKVPIKDKLAECANHFTSPSLVVVVGDKMLAKSITVEASTKYEPSKIPELYDTSSNKFGWYCNGGIIYGNVETRNVEADIQYMRFTGCRPLIKDHWCLTTYDNMDAIHEYYNVMGTLISKIKKIGKVSTNLILYTTRNLRKKMGTNTKWNLMDKRKPGQHSLKEDRNSVKNPVCKDHVIKISKDEYNSIVNKQNLLEQIVVSKLGNIYANKLVKYQTLDLSVYGSKSTKTTPYDSLRAKLRADKDFDVIISVYKNGKDFEIYVFDKLVVNSPYYMHQIDADIFNNTHTITWSDWKTYTSNNTHLVYINKAA